MTRIEWQAKRAALTARKAFGWLVNKLVALAKLLRSLPPELDESHAATRYRMAQMTREEWEAYERAMFDGACGNEPGLEMRDFTPEERESYNEALLKLFQKTGSKFDGACEKEAEECQNQKSHYHI